MEEIKVNTNFHFWFLESERSFPDSTYSISIEQKARVREFLEEIISEMVGGDLDEVPVNQMHQERECEYRNFSKG